MYTHHLCGNSAHATGTMNIRLKNKSRRNMSETLHYLSISMTPSENE
jgi:hypothetical protein